MGAFVKNSAIFSTEALKAGNITFEEVPNQKSRGRCGQERRKPEWGGLLGVNSASLATTNIASTAMDTPSTWWTEDFVDLTSFTTTEVDERGQPHLSSMASEPDVNSAMKMEEIMMEDGPNFAWLEDENAALTKGSAVLTHGQETNSGKLYPQQSGKVISQRSPTPNFGGKVFSQRIPTPDFSSKVITERIPTQPDFRKPASSLVGRRDSQLKLDLSLAVAEAPQLSNSPSCFVQTSQVPGSKKELNITTPDILGPLTDKNSEFNLLAYVFEEDKYPSDVEMKNTNVLNTPEIKPEQLDMSPIFPPKREIPSIIVVKEEPKDIEELYIESPIPEPTRNVKKEPIPVPVRVKEEQPKKSRGTAPRRRLSKQKDKVAVVEPRIKIELDEYIPVTLRHKTNCTDNIVYPPKRRKLSTASEDSAFTDDKYRELRDKNNEASRRSRQNRKSREVEMKGQADELEASNLRLKTKADELQRLVDRLRATLMEVMVRRI